MDVTTNTTAAMISWEEDIITVTQEMLPKGRTLSDCLIRFLAVHAATTIAVGHLTTLQHTNRKEQVNKLQMFLILPTWPIVSLAADISRVLVYTVQGRLRAVTVAYRVGAALGVRACQQHIADDSGTHLLDLDRDPRLLKRRTAPRDILWCARLLVLVTFILQTSSILILEIRRTRKHFPTHLAAEPCKIMCEISLGWTQQPHAAAMFDTLNFTAALGGLIAGLQSFVIMSCNWEWTYSPLGLPPLPPAQPWSSHDVHSPTVPGRRFHRSRLMKLHFIQFVRPLLRDPFEFPKDEVAAVGTGCQILAHVIMWSLSPAWFLFRPSVYKICVGAAFHIVRSYIRNYNVLVVLAAPGYALLLAAWFPALMMPLWLPVVRIACRHFKTTRYDSALLLFYFGTIFSARVLLLETAVHDLHYLQACHRNSPSPHVCYPFYLWRDPEEGLFWGF